MIGWIEDTEVPAVVAETRGVVRAVFFWSERGHDHEPFRSGS
jgi:hypothetical protein